MNKIKINLIRRLIPLVLGVVASLFSTFIILSEFKSFAETKTLIGVFGALFGIIIAYLYARIKDATDAPKIFISYSHKDKEFVEKLYNELNGLRFDILWDKNEIQVGDDIKKKTSELLESSDYLLFVSSQNSSSSKWATMEIDKALELKKKVLPIVIDESKPPKIISSVLYANFSSSFDEGMDELVLALRARRHKKYMHKDSKKLS